MYTMTPNLTSFLFAYEYLKYAEYHGDLKSVEIIAKSATRKSYLPKTFAR
jgi:hypothetical protein